MFNFIGTHKIGILGDANSGKTVLLTSLLWNLEERNLKLGAKKQVPTDVNIHKMKDEARFDYEGNKRKFKKDNTWPDKTVNDYSLIKCSYKLPNSIPRDLTFVDIPGERMADMLIWQNADYDKWSDEMLDSWRESNISEYMKEYTDLLAETSSSMQHLALAYKKGMRKLILNYIPQVTPSTLFFSDGKMSELNDIENDSWLEQRSIWKMRKVKRHLNGSCMIDMVSCDFFPLNEEWKKKDKELYNTCRKHYNLYRQNVVMPLFSQIGSCDNFIICIDVLGILALSPEAFLRTRKELKYFFDKITPGLFGQIWNLIGRNPPRIAFAATKSDKVYGMNLQNLKKLLEDFVKVFSTDKMKFGCFTCTAWTSTSEGQGEYSGMAIAKTLLKKENDENIVADTVLKCPPLPDVWPDSWDGNDYAQLETEILPSKIFVKPPRQTGIDAILNFVTGDSMD